MYVNDIMQFVWASLTLVRYQFLIERAHVIRSAFLTRFHDRIWMTFTILNVLGLGALTLVGAVKPEFEFNSDTGTCNVGFNHYVASKLSLVFVTLIYLQTTSRWYHNWHCHQRCTHHCLHLATVACYPCSRYAFRTSFGEDGIEKHNIPRLLYIGRFLRTGQLSKNRGAGRTSRQNCCYSEPIRSTNKYFYSTSQGGPQSKVIFH